jgi:hypothetical protein
MQNNNQENDFIRFREIVIDDIKSESTQEISEYLHSSLPLWLYTLQNLRREVELQISCQNAKFKMDLSALNADVNFELNTPDQEYQRLSKINDLKTKHYKWRMSVLKFLTNIETKTLYVKYCISSQTSDLKEIQA